MKSVADIEGAELDYWTARALELDAMIALDNGEDGDGQPLCWVRGLDADNPRVQTPYQPSTDAGQGLAAIDHMDVSLSPRQRMTPDRVRVRYWDAECRGMRAEDERVLVAAMRAIVASRFGATVDDERCT